jgi:hypothetical protein
VSTWLQSLGYWEPQVRRRHDTFRRQYLAARGLPPEPTPELRVGYWLAGACNALACALRYHLWRALEAGDSDRAGRADTIRSANDWLWVLRRADALWKIRAVRAAPPDEPPGADGVGELIGWK